MSVAPVPLSELGLQEACLLAIVPVESVASWGEFASNKNSPEEARESICEQLKSSGVFTVELVACGKRLAAGARRHKPFVSKILPEHLLGRGLAPIGTEPVLRTYAGTKPIGANLDPVQKGFPLFSPPIRYARA